MGFDDLISGYQPSSPSANLFGRNGFAPASNAGFYQGGNNAYNDPQYWGTAPGLSRPDTNAVNQIALLGSIYGNRGGGGGGGNPNGPYYGYLGDVAQADAQRYGYDQQYRIAEGNARSAWDLGNLSANTQRYLGDLGAGTERYTSDNTRYGNYDVANIGRQASDYGNLLNYMGRDVESSRGLQGALGVADINRSSALGTAGINAGTNRYVADRGFQAALEQALIDAGVRRYGTDKTLEGQLAGYGSNERIANTQIMPQLAAMWLANQKFNQVFPFVTQLAGGILGKIPNWGGGGSTSAAA